MQCERIVHQFITSLTGFRSLMMTRATDIASLSGLDFIQTKFGLPVVIVTLRRRLHRRLVTIGNGRAVLTDVMINDRSVVDIINELNAGDE